MNRIPPLHDSRVALGPLVLAGLILLAALSRVVPHPPNFSPVEAVALFGGAYFARRSWAIAVPLVAMLIADVVLAAVMGDTYASYLFGRNQLLVYACLALSTVMGFGLRGRVSGGRLLGYSLAGSVLFFLVTNFGVWLNFSLYPKTLDGLIACYVAGLPFFQWTVLGTLFYAAVLFGGFALLRQRVPALRAQTV
ncbi:MAG TPA: DUF6580 family putative transport protein [Lysobacter sp.]|nr:DUF6580 family putative transport protein [Lysobacter sp.]